MLMTPNCFYPTVGAAEGGTELNAFDNALLAAGIGNMNLLCVSSVVPPGAEMLHALPPMVQGSLLPTAYRCAYSTTPGERIAAAVGIGLMDAGAKHGMIYEAVATTEDQAAMLVYEMVLEGFAQRGLPQGRVIVRAVQHTVVRCACVIAAVALAWRDADAYERC